MLNTTQVFARLNLGDSRVTAVQRIREEVEAAKDPVAKANELILAITGVEYKFEDANFARLVAMACGEDAFKANHNINDPAIFLDACVTRVDKMMADPKNSFMFVKTSKPEAEVVGVEVVKDLGVKVAVKANGKIKKGGKQILADAIYTKHVLEAKPALTNQELIALLMKELDMSKAGATTYAYNAKKKLGEPEGGIVKAKRGKKAKPKAAKEDRKPRGKASTTKKPKVAVTVTEPTVKDVKTVAEATKPTE